MVESVGENNGRLDAGTALNFWPYNVLHRQGTIFVR